PGLAPAGHRPGYVAAESHRQDSVRSVIWRRGVQSVRGSGLARTADVLRYAALRAAAQPDGPVVGPGERPHHHLVPRAPSAPAGVRPRVEPAAGQFRPYGNMD